MAASTIEVLLKFTGDPRNAKDAIAQVRADLTKSAQQQVTTARNANKQVATEAKNQTKTLEQEERARVRAAESLQRQRSAALIAQWKLELREKQKIEKEKQQAERGGGADFTVLLNSVPVLRGVTSQLSSLTAEAGAATTATGAMAVGIGAAVAAAGIGIGVLAKLGAEIFDLTKKAAEFQGKFFDLSQQVGVSVETLSTLDVIASTTGGNIDTVTGSLALFQRNLEEAHDPTSKEAKLLKELGVTSLDTETALRQTLKGLFELGETTKQTDSTLLLFGRSGRFINAILKDSKGDLDAAAKAMGGLQISREAAAAADQFNDSLEILNRTLARVVANIVGNSIPIFTAFFGNLNRSLTGNAEDWGFWADAVEREVTGVLGIVQGVINLLKTDIRNLSGVLTADLAAAVTASIGRLREQALSGRAQIAAQAAVDRAERLLGASSAGRPGDRPSAGAGSADKARSEAAARAAKLLQIQQRALEESTRNAERERDRDLKNIDEWETKSITAAGDHLTAQLGIYDQEIANARRFVKGREDLMLALMEIEQKRGKAINDTVEQINKIKEDAAKKRNQAELNLEQQLLKIRDAQRDAELQQIQVDQDRLTITESEAIRRRLVLLEQSHNDRAILREVELNQETVSAERKQELDGQKIESEIRYTAEFKRLTEERMAALAREAAALTPAPGSSPSERDLMGDAKTQILFDPAVLGEVPDALGEWETALAAAKEGFAQLQEQMASFGAFAGGTIINVLQGISGAIADSVVAWALYGKSFGEAMKQGLAAVAARVAGEAAFQGALHAAYAIGSLALGDFRSAGQHAIAAAKFFALAAATGIAAKAIAGNSFQKSGAGSSGGSSGGSTAASTQPAKPIPVDMDRRTANQAATRDVLEIRFTGKLGDVIETQWINQYNGGGRLRNLVRTDRDA